MKAKWIDRARTGLKRKGWKYRELADVLNVTEAAISMYLTGRREPTITQIRKMAAVLDMSVSELLGDDATFISDPNQIKAASIIKDLPSDKQLLAIKILESMIDPPKKD